MLHRKSASMLTGFKVSSLAWKCVYDRPENKSEREPNEIKFWSYWNAKLKYSNG